MENYTSGCGDHGPSTPGDPIASVSWGQRQWGHRTLVLAPLRLHHWGHWRGPVPCLCGCLRGTTRTFQTPQRPAPSNLTTVVAPMARNRSATVGRVVSGSVKAAPLDVPNAMASVLAFQNGTTVRWSQLNRPSLTPNTAA